MSLTIIIPTYKNIDFLPELVSSIECSKYGEEYEVLIGIDYCYDTLNYIYENQFPENFKFYFFTENKGPYIIKNTLSDLSKFDKLLFFDSDDFMMTDFLNEVDTKLDSYSVIKPKYINFTDVNGIKEYKQEKPQFGEGVFGIQKELFLEMNGFEGWKVAADSDFMGRLYKTDVKILHTPHILFHRRQHKNSLTVHPDTNLSSRLRGQYHFLSRQKTSKNVINEKFIVGNYNVVDFENKELLNSGVEIVEETELNDSEIKRLKHESIANIFLNGSKETKVLSEPKTIDYGKINSRSNHQVSSQLGSALRKAKLEDIKKSSRR